MLELRYVWLVHNPGTASEVTALRTIDLAIPKGQFVVVVGSNGAGKSSLVKVISGAQRPTYGRVFIAQRDVTNHPEYRRAAQVAHVFDNPELGTIAELSIEENMALAAMRGRRRQLSKAVTGRRRDRFAVALESIGLGLENRLGDRVGLLSAGQRQSLTMVMATLAEPDILLLDEHVAALDPLTQRKVVELTVDLINRIGCTAVMVTHNMAHAIELGDRVLVMSRGRIICDLHAEEKSRMTAEALVHKIMAAGDVVNDRSVLLET